MARTAADFSLPDHMRIGAWNARHPCGLSARSVLDHPLAEEVIVVFRLTEDLPLWLIVPLRDGKVALSYGHVAGN